MSDQKITDLEEMGDYSIDLMHEISRDINMLTRFSGKKLDNNLNKINSKLDYAKKKGLKVDSLDKQFLDFRVILFKRDIKNKVQDIETKGNNYSLDITRIVREYNELKLEKGIDFQELKNLMDLLDEEVIRAKIKHMVRCISNSGGGVSAHSIEKIAYEIEKAKERGIRIDDIEEMIFG